MAVGLYTNLGRTPVAGRLKKLAWVCEPSVPNCVWTRKPSGVVVQEQEVLVILVGKINKMRQCPTCDI